MAERLLILHLKPARRRAREAATAEVLCLLRDLEAHALAGGPLGDEGSLLWIAVDDSVLASAIERLPWLGYSDVVDLLEPAPDVQRTRNRRDPGHVRWRGENWRLVRVYDDDPEAARKRAPDRRTFLLETEGGDVRPVTGYRGDGGPLSRRGLPVADARLLVNLVFRPERGLLLDPFAGVGGIAIEALAAGWQVVTTDVDPRLRHGLRALGTHNLVADARQAPLASASVDAIATEPPYDRSTAALLEESLREFARVLRPGGRVAMLCVDWQQDLLRGTAAGLGLVPYLDCAIDRKGLAVVVMAWALRRDVCDP